MKNKWRVSVVILCVVMVFGLVGCALKTPEESSVPADQSVAPDQGSSEGDSNEGATITLTVWNEPKEDKEMDMYYQCELATGINVDVTVIPESEYSAKLNQIVASKSDADIMVIWECDIANFVQAGGILPMDDYIAGSNIDNNDFIDAVAKLSEGLGGTYGLPWCAATEVMYYNQDMFDAAGIAYPTNDWSYEDYMDAAAALTQYKEDGTTAVYGCTLPNRQTWWAGVGGAGDQIYDPATGQFVIGDGAVSFVQDCANMVSAGVMPEPSSDTADLFSSGMAAMSWQGSWMIGVYGGDLAFNWDIATIPTNEIKYNTLHTGFYTISSTCENPDAAWEVIEWLMGEKGQAINSLSSGNPSALKTIAAKEEWKVESATTIDNWDAMLDSLSAGVFGYTCLPYGVTENAANLFESALLGQSTPEDAVQQAMEYGADTIGY